MTEAGSKHVQFLAAATAGLSAFAVGSTGGWTSPVVANLEKGDGYGPFGSSITSEQSSWIGSLLAIGAIPGSFIAGYLGEKFGRKRTLLFCAVPFLIGWILVGTASNIIQLYVARFIFGMAQSISFTILPMYCGEIAETSIRGMLGSFLQLYITIGMLYSYAIGPYVSYTVFWILCAIVPIVFFICFMTMPESPYFLLSKGHRDEAIASLVKLRSKSEAAVQKELDEIQMTLDEAYKNQVSISILFKVKANLKALTYACALIFFQQLSGIALVLMYMHSIFLAAGGNVPSEQASIIIAIVHVLASAVTSVIVDWSGRRILLIFSGIGETISLCALGLYFYLKDAQHADDTIEQISWLPVVALVIFIATYCLGWGPVVWTMMGELFASNVKTKASAITVSFCWFLGFLITKFSTNIDEAFGKYVMFWTCGVFCFLSIFFTIFILPETKGKTLQQIQDELSGVTLTTDVENRPCIKRQIEKY